VSNHWQQLFSFIIIILEEIGSEPDIDNLEELVEREVLYIILRYVNPSLYGMHSKPKHMRLVEADIHPSSLKVYTPHLQRGFRYFVTVTVMIS